MSQLIGIGLAFLLLAVVGFALTLVWRAPFRALGILTAGMAFHTFLIMILLRLGTPSPIVRVFQAWKEMILLLLLGLAILSLPRLRGRVGVGGYALPLPPVRNFLPRRAGEGQGGGLVALDLVVLAFAIVAVIYTLLPQSLLHGSANLTQRLLGLRILLMFPALYLFGRIFQPRDRDDLRWIAWVILGAGAVVGLFGLWELWLVPTREWLNWGVNQLSAWLGFRYQGPFGLPANFFQTTIEGYLLRRMLSTYVSPLGIAYAGLVVLPMAVALVLASGQARARWLGWALLALLVAGVLFSLTRLALVLTVAEFLILAVVTRKRWVLYATPVVALLAMFMIFQYVHVGPLMDRNLVPVANRPASLHIATAADPSLAEHTGLLSYDLQYVLQHPLGTGVGSSVHRFGASEGTGESAVFDMFGDMGIVGGLLYLLMYAGCFFIAVFTYFRLRRDSLLAMLPLVCAVAAAGLSPISMTSDLWGDLATTFLFWWSAGASVTLFAASRRPELS